MRSEQVGEGLPRGARLGENRPIPSTLNPQNPCTPNPINCQMWGKGAGGELSRTIMIPKNGKAPGYGQVSDKKKAPKKGNVRLRHVAGLVIILLATVAGAVFHYIATKDIMWTVIEIIFLIPFEISLWLLWIRKDEISEEEAEKIRIRKSLELWQAKEQPFVVEMSFPFSKKYMTLVFIGVILMMLFPYLATGEIIFLIVFMIVTSLAVIGILGINFTGKMLFTIDSLGIRRTRMYIKDFYLPWYRIKKIIAMDMSTPLVMYGKENYVLRAKTDKGRKVMLLSSLVLKQEKFIELYYAIIPFLKNRKIEFDDELGWAK